MYIINIMAQSIEEKGLRKNIIDLLPPYLKYHKDTNDLITKVIEMDKHIQADHNPATDPPITTKSSRMDER
jgi:hypothetical protein